ncbi:adenosylcobalamin-dependent ribonucleoside-diphosphate reductase [Thiobacillus denitrificans]|uniref:adenosylcobalamin-dependent ribonucleoside-diphosphate reductase n=1 Tax=Thiobacillus denitrificans TaxID=36861 RepID=UPI000369E80B
MLMNELSVSNEPQEISSEVLLEKYCKGGETTHEEIFMRVAEALAAVEPKDQEHWKNEFYQAMMDGFVPAGRIASAAGTAIKATLINCFVQPVGDAVSKIVDGKPSIYEALAQAAETMRRGGGVGYDFSSIRPNGAQVKGTHSRASGPLSFMKVFDASCSTVESAGSRRGAQMGVMRCDHPDIEAFIHAKDEGDFRNFNLSIGVTDPFMEAVKTDSEWELVHVSEPDPKEYPDAYQRESDGKWVYRKVQAKDLWNLVMLSTYDHAEPGILFLDRINKDNNLDYCEVIEASNPCAEQMLPPYGCCCLGSTNLSKFVRQPFTEKATFDMATFRKTVGTGIRMLDNVLDATYWPLEAQQKEAHAKRRIGLGFLGLGDALIMLGLKYNTDEGREFAEQIAMNMRDAAYDASIALAKEKGAFPLFDAEKYLGSGFASRLPEDMKLAIAEHGIRNSHLLSIAPTGTISLAFADNASNGIEPAFSWTYIRKKRMADGSKREYEVADHAWRLYRSMGGDMENLPESFVTALEMSASDHMKMLKVVQPYVDSAISKTVNIPADYPYEDFKDLYLEAWEANLKGLATYRPNAVLGAVLSTTPSTPEAPKPEAMMEDNPLRKQFESRPLGDLESLTRKVEYATQEGKKTAYVAISFTSVKGVVNGEEVEIERPFEFFLPAGQNTADHQWAMASMRLLSMAARTGAPIAKALHDMRKVVWTSGPVRCGHLVKDDGTRVPMFHDSETAAIGYSLQQMLIKRGFLDADGNQVPVHALAARFTGRDAMEGGLSIQEDTAGGADYSSSLSYQPTGAKCPECGAFALRKVDGCKRCDACGAEMGCG